MFKRGSPTLHVCERCTARVVREFAEEVKQLYPGWLVSPDADPMDYDGIRPNYRSAWFTLFEVRRASLKEVPCYRASLLEGQNEGMMICESCIDSVSQYLADLHRTFSETGSLMAK